MSDLQLSLLALGAVIIAGVILFNWWQERRFVQDVSRFDAPDDDALMEEFHIDTGRVAGLDNEAVAVEDTVEERIDDYAIAEDATLEELHQEVVEEPFQPSEPEPVTVPEPEPEDMYPDLADAYAEPAAEPPLAEEQAAPVAESAPHAAPRAMPADLDEQVDLIAVMQLDAPLDIAAFDEAVRGLPKFDKPVRWSLRDEAGIWHPWTPELPSGCTRIACALQLADRSGAVSQGTLLAFQEQLADLASGLGAMLEWHGSDHPLPYAAELDQFCVEVDVMVGFHIMQGGSGAFAGTKLRGLAEAGGMKLYEDGAFHYCNAEGATLFSLVSQDQRPFKPETLRTVFYRGVSFQLDVPRVGNCVETFNQMVLFARQMESSLDGMLVDDNQRALGDAEIEKIRQQLKMIHARMVTRGILPGTPIALRLFS